MDLTIEMNWLDCVVRICQLQSRLWENRWHCFESLSTYFTHRKKTWSQPTLWNAPINTRMTLSDRDLMIPSFSIFWALSNLLKWDSYRHPKPFEFPISHQGSISPLCRLVVLQIGMGMKNQLDQRATNFPDPAMGLAFNKKEVSQAMTSASLDWE